MSERERKLERERQRTRAAMQAAERQDLQEVSQALDSIGAEYEESEEGAPEDDLDDEEAEV